MSGYLIDTSIFVASERAAELVDPPDGEARISVATLTELSLGVRRARARNCDGTGTHGSVPIRDG